MYLVMDKIVDEKGLNVRSIRDIVILNFKDIHFLKS